MAKQVEAVYENGLLRPLEPLPLDEHQHVTVVISEDQSLRGRNHPGFHYLESVKKEVARLSTIGSLWYSFPLGKKLGEDGTAVLWIVIYLLGIAFIAPGELFNANLLALAFAVPFIGPRFASAACFWSVGAFLAYQYPKLFFPLCAGAWLIFAIVNWKVRPREGESTTVIN
jgi:predicted DNA-binding antitoxin AbrB/MazE fold protein